MAFDEAVVIDTSPVIVVGAHAFDAEAMAGGWCATLAMAGRRVTLVHLSDGEQGHRTLSPESYAMQKRGEADLAATIMGVEQLSLHLPDTAVTATNEVVERVARLIREVRPGICIGHWSGSWHRDHRAAHQVFMDSLFLAALPTVMPDVAPFAPEAILFAENWEDAEGFQPSMYVDITPGYERWLAALDAYELCRGDIAAFPYRDYYTSLARLRGCISGDRYAEAFMPLRADVAAGFGIFAGHRAPSTPRGHRPGDRIGP